MYGKVILLFWLIAVQALAADLPAGTKIQIRLQKKVSSDSSKPKDPVDAVVIAPVLDGDRFLVPAGTLVHGSVKEVRASAKPNERAVLQLEFSELVNSKGEKTKLNTKVIRVDNARESIDEQGRILGILASETLSSRIDQGIGKLSAKYGGLAEILSAAKGTVLKAAEGEIVYDPGVEVTLTLTQPANFKTPPGEEAGPKLIPIGSETELISLVGDQPFQTMAENPPKPSDITNVMFIGSREQLESAFAAAGWSQAAEMSGESKLETFRAIAEMRGYREAPVSLLLLDGRKPDLVFQKQNNTFAQRHHLRVWRRPARFEEKDVWVSSGTHDIGIDFSQENRTFIHKIDPQIDRERAKVVNDLLLTGHIRSLALVDRPAVPKESRNATGDAFETDGKMVVLIFK